MQTYLNIFKTVSLSNLFRFSGRGTRTEYICVFFTAGFCICLALLGPPDFISQGLLLMSMLALIAASVRRMHDTGAGWGAILSVLIPYAGIVIYLYSMMQDGQDGHNEHGPDPRNPQDNYL